MIAFRYIRPSWRNYIDYAALAAQNGDKDMDRLVKCWEALDKREKKAISPEQLCSLANLPPDDLVGAVCASIWRAKSAEGSLVSAIAHPRILERTAKAAEKTANNKDRELFFRVTGSLPDKKGASVIIQNNPQTLVASQPTAVGGLMGKQQHGLPSMDEDVIDISRRLEAPAEAVSLPFLVDATEE